MANKADDVCHLINWEANDSPFYKKSHHQFRKLCRDFTTKEILPYIDKWSKKGDVPKSFYKKAYDVGIYARFYPKFMGGTPTSNDPLQALDMFYLLIFTEELCRAGAAGLLAAGWIHGLVVAPILINGTPYQKQLMKKVITAEKFAALCISEPVAGSDVKNIQTTATKQGDYYIISGQKYWITGGMKADYFLTACRTVENGIKGGICLILIERQAGVTTTRLDLQGHDCSATAYVLFNNVKVHKKMVVVSKKEGFKATMKNFNNERIGIICQAVGLARCCIEEAVAYAKERKVFGKPLIESQVIRHKLGEMARLTHATHSYLETVAYRMKVKPFSVDPHLIRDVALLKVQATKTLEFCAREASQIFGGRSYIRGSGRASKVERIYRDVRALAIYGGSEEIMLDLAIRQSKL